MTMVMLPSTGMGDLCLNPDTASWILPGQFPDTCAVLMTDGTSYQVGAKVEAMQEMFADSFVLLPLYPIVPWSKAAVLVNPLLISRVTYNDDQSSLVFADGSSQMIAGTVIQVSEMING